MLEGNDVENVIRKTVVSYTLKGCNRVEIEDGHLLFNYGHVSYEQACLLALAALEAVAESGDEERMDHLLSIVLPAKGGAIDISQLAEIGVPGAAEEMEERANAFETAQDLNHMS
jgi:hypothetical protein